ncbi:hypothetical protein JTB14_019247 [Gonioctena quinquepunctata]|nr:hypothetical protein JTB14_019247 [Gonioctena quinquepunctata]
MNRHVAGLAAGVSNDTNDDSTTGIDGPEYQGFYEQKHPYVEEIRKESEETELSISVGNDPKELAELDMNAE